MDSQSPTSLPHSQQWLQRLPLLALMAANLIPLYGVLAWGWDAVNLVILFWIENLIIGGYVMLRMVVLSPLKGIVLSYIFQIHFSIFCAFHGGFIYLMLYDTGIWPEQMSLSHEGVIDSFFGVGIVYILPLAMADYYIQRSPDFFLLPIIAMVISHGLSFISYSIMSGEEKLRNASQLMFAPYKRIILTQLVVIVGGALTLMFEQPMALLVVLVLVKVVFDLKQHKASY